MRKNFVLVFVVLMGFYLVSAPGEKTTVFKGRDLSVKPGGIEPVSSVKPDINFGKIPLYFIFNKGQVNERAKFYAKASRYTLWLTKEGLVFDSFKKTEIEKRFSHTPHSTHPPKTGRDVSKLMFVGSDSAPVMVPIDAAKLRVNYFKGNDKSKWHCDVPTSMAVLYKSLYKKIDLKVYGLEKQIEYDWIVKPGGDTGDIKFQYTDVEGTRIDEKGNLLIQTQFGELVHKKPVSYQLVNGKREKIESRFKKMAENTYGFEVGAYDGSRELIIDPVVLAYSTYLGGGYGDWGNGIAVDAGGNAYVAGHTGADFPLLDQYQGYQGNSDVFVTRLDTNSSGTAALLYSTYLGGGDYDKCWGIAVDAGGNAYVTGSTKSTDFPLLDQYQGHIAYNDVFVTRLDTNISGTASLKYSTCLGGGDWDVGQGIAVDAGGNAYVTGYTGSADFPLLDQYQGYQGVGDVFVTRLDTNSSGTASLKYSTHLGGSSGEEGRGIAVDAGGNAYVTGATFSMDFPTRNEYMGDPGDDEYDLFVTRLDTNSSGTASLKYSTYFGGGGLDVGWGIAVDAGGNAYVGGWTFSTDFPTRNEYMGYAGDGGKSDAIVVKLDTNSIGTASLKYSTYLGGSEDDQSFGIAVDAGGNAYVAGQTYSTNFPTRNEYMGEPGDGWWDIFVARLDPAQCGAASLIYSTYLGGGNQDHGYIAIAVDDGGNAYVTGITSSTDFPLLYQYQGYQGGGDAFVTRLYFDPTTPPYVESIVAKDTVGNEYPCTTIQEAVDTAGDGWGIEVGSGTYDESITVIDKTDVTIITNCGAVINGGFILGKNTGVTIDGFIIDAAGQKNHGIKLKGGISSNTDTTIRNCDISDADTSYSGISVTRGNPGTAIIDNVIHHNGRNGIMFVDAVGGPHFITNNTIEANGWNGVAVPRAHIVTLTGNTIIGNGINPNSTGGRYGVKRGAVTGPGLPDEITLINNTIENNMGNIQPGKSSLDLGTYDQMLDPTDSGNCTTAGDEGTGVGQCL